MLSDIMSHARTSDTVEIIRGVAVAQGIGYDLHHGRPWVHEEHVGHAGSVDAHENMSTGFGLGQVRMLGYL